MKKNIILIAFIGIAFTTHAQFLKKLKDKVNKSVGKPVDKTVGTDKPKTEIEKKEDAARSEYNDATENHENPVFIDKAPDNGKMLLKLRKGDRFSGGYIQVKSQPEKKDPTANILDYIKARVASFYDRGEISAYALYFDGKRILDDSSSVAIRPQFITYQLNKTEFFSGTEASVNPATGFGTTQEDATKMMKVAGNGKEMSEEEMEKMAAAAQQQLDATKNMTEAQRVAYYKKNTKTPSAEDQKEMKQIVADSKNHTGPSVTQGEFVFKLNEKKYGPFTGAGIGMYVLKPMEDGKPKEKFYGLGAEPFYGEKEAGYHALIQTEKKLIKINDYAMGGLFEPTWPTGAMVVVQGKAFHFSNGATIAIPKNPSYLAEGQVVGVVVYGTDSGHVVTIPTTLEQVATGGATTAYVDYQIKLSYPLPIDKEHLLIASNPSKSIFYKNHVLYYADGRNETISNVGDAQLCNFNGKDYIVWFEVMKAEDGHEIYVCQKELK